MVCLLSSLSGCKKSGRRAAGLQPRDVFFAVAQVRQQLRRVLAQRRRMQAHAETLTTQRDGEQCGLRRPAGQLAIEARLAERARTYRRRRALAAGTVRTSVRIDNEASSNATVVEVRAPDRELRWRSRSLADRYSACS